MTTRPDTGSGELRRLLLDAALHILEEPDTPLDLRKVAETAGKSRTAPYLVFGKESAGGGLLALRMAVAAEGVRAMADRMEKAERSSTDPVLAFRSVALALLSFASEHPRLFRLMYGLEMGSVSSVPPGQLADHPELLRLGEQRRRAEAAVRRVVEQCQARGIAPPGNPARYAKIAWTSLLGAAFLVLDQVQAAAGAGAGLEDAANLVIESVLGLVGEPLAETTSSFLTAQSKSQQTPRTTAGEVLSTYPGLRRAAQARRALPGARILWIDDDPRLNEPEIATLEGLGVEVTTASGTKEAVRILEKDAFDLIISDIERPEGRAAGLEGLRELRTRAPDTPVVFYVGQVDRSRGVPTGAAGIADSADELFHLIVDVMERRG